MISVALGMRILPSCLCSDYAERLAVNAVFLLKPFLGIMMYLVYYCFC